MDYQCKHGVPYTEHVTCLDCIDTIKEDLVAARRRIAELEDAYENCRKDRDGLSEAADERTEHHYRRLQADTRVASLERSLREVREHLDIVNRLDEEGDTDDLMRAMERSCSVIDNALSETGKSKRAT